MLHEGTVSPVREKNIPLNIRNTNQPEHPGTMIRETFEESETERTSGSMITGIAGKKGFSVITLTKNGMSSELGAIRRILEILERYHINVEYIPSGIDSVSLVVETGKSSPYLYQAMGDLEKEIKPDSLHLTDGMAIVAAVVSANSAKILTSGLLIVAVVILHNLLGYATGFAVGKALHLSSSKCRAISIEVGMQNSGLATSLAAAHFAQYPLATIPGAVFSVWHNISGAVLANFYARTADKQ